MDGESQNLKGLVNEVGLRRDEEKFNSFNVTIAMVLKSEKALTYDQGERLMSRIRRDLLGKEVEITSVVFPCPVCGRTFNTEQGMRQHARMAHKEKRAKKPKEAKRKGTQKKPARKKSTRKKSSKRASKKK